MSVVCTNNSGVAVTRMAGAAVTAAAGSAVMAAKAGGGGLGGGGDGGGGLSGGGEGGGGEGGGGEGGGGLSGGNEGGGSDEGGGGVGAATSICPATLFPHHPKTPGPSCGTSSVISKSRVPAPGARTTGGAQQKEGGRGALASSSRLASARHCRPCLCLSVFRSNAACCLGLRLDCDAVESRSAP
jgi:hypothetical protein